MSTPPDTPADPCVSAAFALGWHMSELQAEHTGRHRSGTPVLSRRGQPHQLTLTINQVVAGVSTLAPPLTLAGLDPINLTDLKALVQDPGDEDPVLTTHQQLLTELKAADPRLGNAYGLGRALADSCRCPHDFNGLRTELSPHRIANLLRWLDDLSSALPAHAAHSVATSLRRWQDALHPPDDRRGSATTNPLTRLKSWRERRRRPRPISATDAQAIDQAVKALPRQGELWRELLSGEKRPTDMLEIDNYVDAGKELAKRMAAVARRALLRMPLLSLGTLALIVVGVWLLAQGSSSQLVAGATSVVAAVGLTWKGIGGALTKLAERLEQPLWCAVLDDAIADAITLLPDNTAERGGRRAVALSEAAGGDISGAPA